MRRRGFLAAPVSAGLSMAAPGGSETHPVIGYGDGVPAAPQDYAATLGKLPPDSSLDNYGFGGVVEKLEKHMAAELGKEFAVWMPTGTLANHLALRVLAGDRRRVFVQAESHIYNDCGDCCQTLSNLNLVALAPGRATFSLEEVVAEAKRAGSGRVATPIGAIQMESPVRRKSGELFDIEQMRKISAWARSQSIGMHLDGARLYLASAYSGIAVKEYAALFDTVYVSMYKYFGAASGAILAGPRSLLSGMFHTRRMFGGGQSGAWPLAGVAYQNVPGFGERFAAAVKRSETVIAQLRKQSQFQVKRIPNGTNLFQLEVTGVEAKVFRRRAGELGLLLPPPLENRFLVGVNETWNRAEATEIVRRLEGALKG